MKLIKPNKLQPGDKVATISLSWGGAGDEKIRWRYEVGKQRLQTEFGLQVVEMPHTLSGSDFLYNHPQKRAEDLMLAFKDPSIKAIFSCIGGSESVRILPYIDYQVIRDNPKIFVGYSDSTVTHFICLKAGISSFYGPSILAEFAENVSMFDYTKQSVQDVLFQSDPIGSIAPSLVWTSQFLAWEEKNKDIQRSLSENSDYELVQGKGVVQGRLIGGCIEVLEMLKGTEVWPSIQTWEDSVLFFETSEEKTKPSYLEYWLRNYGSQDILQKATAIIFGKPYDNQYYQEYKSTIVKVVRDELKLDIPIMLNMSFGHTAPMFTLPYGAMAEIDCDNKRFSILESGVL